MGRSVPGAVDLQGIADRERLFRDRKQTPGVDDGIKTIDVLMGKDVYALLEGAIDKCEIEDLNP